MIKKIGLKVLHCVLISCTMSTLPSPLLHELSAVQKGKVSVEEARTFCDIVATFLKSIEKSMSVIKRVCSKVLHFH